jgi:transglutaminase-like putative cysteine protease
MNLKKYLPLFLCSFFLITNLFSQEKLTFKFGKLDKEDFEIKSSLIDSNTNAIVVADVGKSEFRANASEQTFSLFFKQKKRIKILNKNGFDAATITIPLYVSNDGTAEKLEELKAYTYNIENGKVVETKLDKDQIFTEKYNKNWVHKKFTFPAVKEGSIIEYTYEVKSDFFFNFQSWEFQGPYPVLWSQYEAAIPEFYKYLISTQGYQTYAINKSEPSTVSFKFTESVERDAGYNVMSRSGRQTFSVDGNLDYHTWVMKNVPALKEEPFTTTLRNSISKIEFQLQQIAYRGSLPKNYTNTWEKLSTELIEHEDFGRLINRPNNWLDNDVELIVGNAITQKEKAKKIYEYLRNNFTCTNYNGFMVNKGLKDVFKNKSGSVADINMLLIAMLRSIKIEVDPVLLSTREHGVVNSFYPLIDKFNYIIAEASIDGQIIYLDATRQRLPFGKLPLSVYNGHARVINKFASAVYFEADSLLETSTTTVFLANTEKGAVEGFLTNTLGTYGSLEFRNKIAKTTLEDHKKVMMESYSDDIKMSNISMDSLTLLDEPVAIKFDIELKAFGDASIVYFNPLMGEAIKTNPFTAAERFYPVEMPYTKSSIYVLSMEIPEGYKVDELPKSARVNLNDNEGVFEYLISNDGKYIQMKCKLDIRKATFSNEEYQTLRDFYSYVVKKEAEQIVFKKIK